VGTALRVHVCHSHGGRGSPIGLSADQMERTYGVTFVVVCAFVRARARLLHFLSVCFLLKGTYGYYVCFAYSYFALLTRMSPLRARLRALLRTCSVRHVHAFVRARVCVGASVCVCVCVCVCVDITEVQDTIPCFCIGGQLLVVNGSKEVMSF